MTARTRAARAAASLVFAGALLVGTVGCTFISTQATLIQYDPSDGVGTRVGTVDIRNVIALPNDDGHAVSLLVTLINSGDSSAKVVFQYENDGEKNEVDAIVGANSVASFGNLPEQKQLVLMTIDAKAGSLLPVYVQYGNEEGVQLLVPVLDPNTPTYEDLKPPAILR